MVGEQGVVVGGAGGSGRGAGGSGGQGWGHTQSSLLRKIWGPNNNWRRLTASSGLYVLPRACIWTFC